MTTSDFTGREATSLLPRGSTWPQGQGPTLGLKSSNIPVGLFFQTQAWRTQTPKVVFWWNLLPE